MKPRIAGESGVSMVEFAIVGPILLLATISIFQLCLGMWNYETLAFAVREGARYAAMKGQGCSYGTNSCGVTVASVVTRMESNGPGLILSEWDVTLSASGGGSVTCSPITNCASNSTAWPPSSGNTENSSTLTISATYPFNLFFMPRQGSLQTSSGNLRASTQQIVQF